MPNSTLPTSPSSGNLPLTAAVIAELRQAFILDFGHDDKWSDEELQTMAANTLHFIAVIRRIASAQRQRQL